MAGLCLFARGRLGTNGQRWAVSWKAEAKGLSKRKLGSGKAALIQPALSLCSLHAGVRKPCFHMGALPGLWGGSKRVFPWGAPVLGRVSRSSFSFPWCIPAEGSRRCPGHPLVSHGCCFRAPVPGAVVSPSGPQPSGPQPWGTFK